jgi:hypothetical protein
MSASLESVLSLTEDMLTAAHAGDFDRVAVLDAERRAMLEMCILPDANAGLLLARIIERDRRLVAIVETARCQAAEQLRHARLAQAGAGTYLGVAFAR